MKTDKQLLILGIKSEINSLEKTALRIAEKIANEEAPLSHAQKIVELRNEILELNERLDLLDPDRNFIPF